LSFADMALILDDGVVLGVSRLAICGGEPFVRRDMFEVMTNASQLGYDVRVTTKTCLTRPQLELLRQSNVWVVFSLDSTDLELTDRLVRAKGFGKRMLQTIRDAKELGVWFTVQMNVNAQTIAAMDRSVRELCELGVRSIALSEYFPVSCSEEKTALSLPRAGEDQALAIVRKYSEEFGLGDNITFSNTGDPQNTLCDFNYDELAMLPDGTACTCPGSYSYSHPHLTNHGKIQDTNLYEAWHRESIVRNSGYCVPKLPARWPRTGAVTSTAA
jgi:MoaA/NifB/PqqE/SkfB family radical SAM enzyme